MKETQKKVAFTGPFTDVNFGDYAMLVNNVYDLGVNDLLIFSYDNDFLTKIKNDYMVDKNLEIYDVILKDKDILTSEEYINTPLDLLDLVNNYEEVSKKIESIDVLIVNGGGYFNGLWSQPHRIGKLVKIMIPILIANQLNKKIVFTGNGFGPFGKDGEFFSCFFNSLNNVTFGLRDNLYSPMWLKQLGIKTSDNLHSIPDDLYLLNEKLLNDKPKVNLNSPKYIVLETYFHMDYLKENIEYFRNFSEKILDLYGLNVVFLPFSLEYGGVYQAEFLSSELNNFEVYDIKSKGYLPIEDAHQIIENAELVISNRYHALVVSLATQTPIINVLRNVMGDKRYYFNKGAGMLRLAFKDMPIDETLYLHLDFLQTLDYVLENYDQIIEKQTKNYNSQYTVNREKLKRTREDYIQQWI